MKASLIFGNVASTAVGCSGCAEGHSLRWAEVQFNVEKKTVAAKRSKPIKK